MPARRLAHLHLLRTVSRSAHQEPDNPPVDWRWRAARVFGASGWSLGSSYFSSVHNGRWNYLGGLDGLWREGRWELSGEFLGGHGDPVGARIFGLYVQGAVQLVDSVYGIGRYEYYDPGTTTAVDLFDAGLAWRPFPILILKADYLFANIRSEFGQPLRASISLLFREWLAAPSCRSSRRRGAGARAPRGTDDHRRDREPSRPRNPQRRDVARIFLRKQRFGRTARR